MSSAIARVTSYLVTIVVVLIAGMQSSRASVLEPGWTETPWLSANASITSMAWAPDGSGRLFLTDKFGEILIVHDGPPPSLSANPFATVSPLFTNSECGLLGIAFDPDFLNNGYVYVFATVSSSEQQIIRYTASGDVGVGKTVAVAGLPTRGEWHDGGGLGFGRDGKLYWSIGDLANSMGVDGDLASLASKVGRANRDGSVPADNPFMDGGGGNNDHIFARGFRNPFTFTFQPETGKLWVNVAGSQYEQVFAVDTADHAGWNNHENNQPAGFVSPVIKYRTNGTDTRTLLASGGAVRSSGVTTFTTTATHGFRQGEKITIAGVSNGTFDGDYYVATAPSNTTFTVSQTGANASSGGGTAATQNIGGAITGGTFYDATGAPPAYRGNFFFGDFNSGRIMRAAVGPGGVTSVDDFATEIDGSIDVSVGPDGALYYVNYVGDIYRAAWSASVQDIVVSRRHLWMDEEGRSLFNVRLALPPPGNVTVNVARTSGPGAISVWTGASLTFTPSNYSTPQPVTIQSAAGTGTDAALFSVSSAGLTSQTVTVNVVADAPGSSVPGVAGGLTVRRNATNPADLDLDWAPGCGSPSDYSIHEGILGDWYSHQAVLCTTQGATAATITPGASSRYYLIVPLDRMHEGSYGAGTLGSERPPSSATCHAERDTTSCP